MATTTYHGPGIRLVLDTDDEHTPAMVYSAPRDAYSATFECAVGACELSGEMGDMPLNGRQLAWLEQHEAAVDAAFEVARAHWEG
jgi:hypothetical protein